MTTTTDADRTTESPGRHDDEVRIATAETIRQIRHLRRLLITRLRYLRKSLLASTIRREVEREDCAVLKDADIRHC